MAKNNSISLLVTIPVAVVFTVVAWRLFSDLKLPEKPSLPVLIEQTIGPCTAAAIAIIAAFYAFQALSANNEAPSK